MVWKKGLYCINFCHLAKDLTPFYTGWYANGKYVALCSYKDSRVVNPHCASRFGGGRNGYKVGMDTVPRIVSTMVSWKKILGENKLICWSTGPTDPILSKTKKNNITKFWVTGKIKK